MIRFYNDGMLSNELIAIDAVVDSKIGEFGSRMFARLSTKDKDAIEF